MHIHTQAVSRFMQERLTAYACVRSPSLVFRASAGYYVVPGSDASRVQAAGCTTCCARPCVAHAANLALCLEAGDSSKWSVSRTDLLSCSSTDCSYGCIILQGRFTRPVAAGQLCIGQEFVKPGNAPPWLGELVFTAAAKVFSNSTKVRSRACCWSLPTPLQAHAAVTAAAAAPVFGRLTPSTYCDCCCCCPAGALTCRLMHMLSCRTS